MAEMMQQTTKEEEAAIIPLLNSLKLKDSPESDQITRDVIGTVTGKIPGVSMSQNPLVDDIRATRKRAEELWTQQDRERTALREKEDAARRALATKKAEGERSVVEAMKNRPQMGEMKPTPEAPQRIEIPQKEMAETLSLITALAAIGGALTRQPLTASLNNFSAAVKGYVTGNQKVFDDNLKSFEANLKQAKAANDAAYEKYKRDVEKFGVDIQGLQKAALLNSIEEQNELSRVLLQNGRLKEDAEIWDKRISNMNKTVENAAKIINTINAQKAQQQRHEENLAARVKQAEQQATIARERMAVQQEIAAQRMAAQERIAAEKAAAAKGKAEGSGLKGKLLDSYIHNDVNINAVDEIIKELAKNPEAVGYKTLVPHILLNRADPEGTPVRADIANMTSMTIKNRAGTAQTVGEMKNLAPFIPRNGDDYDTVVTKLRGMQKAMRAENEAIMKYGAGGKQPAAPATQDQPPPVESRQPGVTKWRGYTWDGKGWAE